MIVDLQSKQDMERYRGKLAGMAILSTPPAAIDIAAMTNGVRRRTESGTGFAGARGHLSRGRPQRRCAVGIQTMLLTAVEKMAFYKAEGVVVVF
ncbi:MAG: hypothetical protein IPP98_10180 [Gemmatimonadetes bacterium]|nr:hypothetical protein [Gemmatimonadota bacterium]